MISRNKIDTVNTLIGILESAKLIMFLDIQGVCAEDMRKLRNMAFEHSLKIKVFKNTLQKIAFCKSSLKNFDIKLVGQTALLWDISDSLNATRILSNLNDVGFKIKSGIHGGAIISKEYIKYLSSIPDLNTLRAKLSISISLIIKKMLFVIKYYPMIIIKILKSKI